MENIHPRIPWNKGKLDIPLALCRRRLGLGVGFSLGGFWLTD
jgi:hypothetical protein